MNWFTGEKCTPNQGGPFLTGSNFHGTPVDLIDDSFFFFFLGGGGGPSFPVTLRPM